jgi:hypothetical protein
MELRKSKAVMSANPRLLSTPISHKLFVRGLLGKNSRIRANVVCFQTPRINKT